LAERANLFEIFSSVQGEGTHVGESTLFVRFAGCDLRCRWCDSPDTWRPTTSCEIEAERGAGGGRRVANPLPIEDVVAAAEALELTAHRWVSFTGGEPLLQPEAVAALARALRGRGPRIYLETHGLAHSALEQVLPAVDLVSMDWKLRSDVRRASEPTDGSGADFHEAHAAFLKVARAAPEVLVKVVVTPATRDGELDAMAARVAAIDPAVPVVVQPVTPFGGVRETPGAERLLEVCARLSSSLADVRLIPQTHRLYGAR
jgi:7-carboxy-7-deazaguanine synthase